MMSFRLYILNKLYNLLLPSPDCHISEDIHLFYVLSLIALWTYYCIKMWRFGEGIKRFCQGQEQIICHLLKVPTD